MSISKIEEINKLNKINKIKGILWDLWSAKDEKNLNVHGTIDLKAKSIYKLLLPTNYTKQILSLIEELEGKLNSKRKQHEILEGVMITEPNFITGYNSAIDQMRATIKSYKKGI